MTELILVRHGEAQCNVTGIAGGPLGCTGLTETGWAQARLLGRRLRNERIDVGYVGPRRRVHETGVALGIPLVPEPGLAGLRHGVADGRPWREIEAEFGGSPMAHPDRPYALGAERWNCFVARTAALVHRMAVTHAGGRILLVGHGETVAAATEVLLQMDPRIAVDNASITRILLPERTLIAHNDTDHLDDRSGVR